MALQIAYFEGCIFLTFNWLWCCSC